MSPQSVVGADGTLPREKVERFDRDLAHLLGRYPPDRKAAALIPALRLGQEIFGLVSAPVQRLAAERLGVSPSRAEEVATFYVMFNTEPTGRHVVELCTNVSCCLSGSERLWAHLQRKLGVKPGGTTADGRITLREVECLGSCGTAPAMLVDEEMHERLSLERVDAILGDLE
jgi:NADH-quinone oxidoreductase subunit E